MNQNVNNISQEDIEAVDIMVKHIVKAIKSQEINCDRTFVSAVKAVNPNGTYTIMDESGCDRKVKYCIPGVNISVGKNVWVKIPCGNLNNIHICGVV